MNGFRSRHDSKAEFIASHGVTVFHQPARGITTQLGSGAIISALTGLTTICDFRLQDVSKHGQGAPLVPGCDKALFPSYTHTLNLGGFANLSVLRGSLTGYDIAPCNLLLNERAATLGLTYDEGGNMARGGNLIPALLNQLNNLLYYASPPPKSLGTEWIASELSPIIERWNTSPIDDQMHTLTEHIATQIGAVLNDKDAEVLVTGGGAYNHYLIERIRYHSVAHLVVPEPDLIEYREAICFAFLGLKRLLALPNVFAQSTGANGDSCAGAVYLP